MHCVRGSTNSCKYAFPGWMSKLDREESIDVHSLIENLSLQDFDNVSGASAREGLRRTMPSSEKYPLPFITCDGSHSSEAIVHGVASSWELMTSSMLASPQGASEEYMKIFTPSLMAKGWKLDVDRSSPSRLLRMLECILSSSSKFEHSWRRKKLKARIATISACQSCRVVPWANVTFVAGRHFIPVLLSSQ